MNPRLEINATTIYVYLYTSISLNVSSQDLAFYFLVLFHVAKINFTANFPWLSWKKSYTLESGFLSYFRKLSVMLYLKRIQWYWLTKINIEDYREISRSFISTGYLLIVLWMFNFLASFDIFKEDKKPLLIFSLF